MDVLDCMVITAEMSHFEISALNATALLKAVDVGHCRVIDRTQKVKEKKRRALRTG